MQKENERTSENSNMGSGEGDSIASAEIFEGEVTAEDEKVANLEKRLAEIENARKEDQFLFIAVCVILLDIVFFTVISGLGALGIVLLELLILIPLASKMGMHEVKEIMNNVLNRASNNFDRS